MKLWEVEFRFLGKIIVVYGICLAISRDYTALMHKVVNIHFLGKPVTFPPGPRSILLIILWNFFIFSTISSIQFHCQVFLNTNITKTYYYSLLIVFLVSSFSFVCFASIFVCLYTYKFLKILLVLNVSTSTT